MASMLFFWFGVRLFWRELVFVISSSLVAIVVHINPVTASNCE